MLNLPNRFHFEGQKVAWGVIGEGTPLVLIHGTPFSSQVWRKIAPLLAGKFKVYFFDLLGYGLSEKSDHQNVSLEVQNRLLVALLNEWGLVKPEVLCHDFGGATALRAYYLNGIRYTKLTIIDPVAIAPWGSPFVLHVRKHEAAFSGLPEFAHNALLAEYLQTSAYSELTKEALDVYMAPWQGKEGQLLFIVKLRKWIKLIRMRLKAYMSRWRIFNYCGEKKMNGSPFLKASALLTWCLKTN